MLGCSKIFAVATKSVSPKARGICPSMLLQMRYIEKCTFVARTCVHISSQNRAIKTIILPDNKYSTLENFKEKIEKQTGCQVGPDVDQYACSVIQESEDSLLQVVLQGSNKVKIQPHNNKEIPRHGIVFSGEYILDIVLSDTPSQDNDAVYFSKDNGLLLHHDVHIDVKDAIQEGTPLFINTLGFMVLLDVNLGLKIVLYSPDSYVKEREEYLIYSKHNALGLGSIMRGKISSFLHAKFIPSMFEVQGVYDFSEDRDESKMCPAVFVPRELGEHDRVVILRFTDKLRESSSFVDRTGYELIHIENKYNDYSEPKRLQDSDIFTAYFYNSQRRLVAVQKGDTYLDEKCFFEVSRRPELTTFESGNQGILIQGIAVDYDSNANPREVHIIDEALSFGIQSIDDKVYDISGMMIKHSLEDEISLGKILLKDLPYQTDDGEKYSLNGYFDMMRGQYIFNDVKRSGQVHMRLPEYDGEGSSMVYSSTYDGERYRLYVSSPLRRLYNIVTTGVIMEEKLPGLEELFPYLKIKNVIPSKDGVLLRLSNENIVLGKLNGKDSYINLVSISTEFIKEYGYNPSVDTEVRNAIHLAQLLYGPLLEPSHAVVTKSDNQESSVFDMEYSETIAINTKPFYIDKLYSRKKRVYVKGANQSPLVRLDVGSKDIYEELNPLSVKALGYYTNNDGSKSMYMWSPEAEALIVNTEPATSENTNRVYHTDIFLQKEDTALLRLEALYNNQENIGLVIPGVSSITFQPSHSEHRMILRYSSNELQHIEEIILDSDRYNGVLPLLHFQLNIKLVVIRHFLKKDVRIILEYQNNNEESRICSVILSDFFIYADNVNPYDNCLTINNDKYTVKDITQNIERAENK